MAAGKGKRMNSKEKNKVSLELEGRSMISYSIALLNKVQLVPIVVVVGFAKESVKKALKRHKVLYAEQKKRLGTAHAVWQALKVLPKEVSGVLIVNGDDSYLYPARLLKRLIRTHQEKQAILSLLTIEKENPFGLGRILRNSKGKVVGIVEHKDATEEQKRIKEINPQCWVFQRKFLEEFLPKVKKSKVTGEYYLTDLVELAVRNNKKIEAIKGGKIPWRGVNTPEELKEARRLIKHIKIS